MVEKGWEEAAWWLAEGNSIESSQRDVSTLAGGRNWRGLTGRLRYVCTGGWAWMEAIVDNQAGVLWQEATPTHTQTRVRETQWNQETKMSHWWSCENCGKVFMTTAIKKIVVPQVLLLRDTPRPKKRKKVTPAVVASVTSASGWAIWMFQRIDEVCQLTASAAKHLCFIIVRSAPLKRAGMGGSACQQGLKRNTEDYFLLKQ